MCDNFNKKHQPQNPYVEQNKGKSSKSQTKFIDPVTIKPYVFIAANSNGE